MIEIVCAAIILLLSNIIPKIICLIARILAKFIRLQISTPRFGVFSNISFIIPLTSYFSFGVAIKTLTIQISWRNCHLILQTEGVDLRFIQTSMVKSNDCENEIRRVAKSISKLSLIKVIPKIKPSNAFMLWIVAKLIVNDLYRSL